ncbi:NNP family nitrate/nitrite transporter-like MFS transporter [Flavobacterium sp. 90]|uniref:magnesium transporter MgtE N-terminal domain-containing protein n=1 Tax=unclassified Flavobacterium TaxID=196869 RepID=UPI000EAC328F|nr:MULTISPECIES: MFS transporter [unclassified Flavobacterium]RKR11802.1 NNP family nitrate/nitrite transporter-like MFS transporter [Flavobacterium sp. 81]TCK55577.1 NNP family nitrate/nitrite transporter-like MFS transporter [Flavobacterium sp. 90]
MKTWLDKWEPEDDAFWNATGSKIAWRTLTITTLTLILSFASWFMMSVIAVKLPGLGFYFSKDQLFWLTAIPGLAAGVLRIIHTFILPIFGTRHIVSFATAIKLIPVIGIGFAVMDTSTPFWVFAVLAFTTGFGGGDFSSYMPSTSLFFPKRLKGTALGIQAGIGNFGVSVAQFVTPLIISISIYGAASVFTSIDHKEAIVVFQNASIEKQKEVFAGLIPDVQARILTNVSETIRDSVSASIKSDDKVALFAALPVKAKAKAIANANPKMAEKILNDISPSNTAVKNQEIYLQSAAFWYAPFLILLAFISWFYLKSIPMKASVREQMDIFSNKHTWYCTITYVMTFGTFAGLSAAFPLMIKFLYGDFPNAPDPLVYAFYGPLIGSASRIAFGFVADRVGGAILTTITGLGILGGSIILVTEGLVAPTSMEQFPLFVTVILAMFFFTGIGNAGTFRQYPIIFQENQRQAAGVIGWTAAIAAFGPFIFSKLIGNNLSANGTVNQFFIGVSIFTLLATGINWWFYNRKGCEKPS